MQAAKNESKENNPNTTSATAQSAITYMQSEMKHLSFFNLKKNRNICKVYWEMSIHICNIIR